VSCANSPLPKGGGAEGAGVVLRHNTWMTDLHPILAAISVDSLFFSAKNELNCNYVRRRFGASGWRDAHSIWESRAELDFDLDGLDSLRGAPSVLEDHC
jgi:hypothetical protein